MSSKTAPPEEILELIIRFTASIPDLTLQIRSPKTTTTLVLKTLIRGHLQGDDGSKRLRLIYSGKILEDATSLFRNLGLKEGRPPSPPRSTKALGKQPARDDVGGVASFERKYIHCSVGDTLSKSDLEEEAHKAEESMQALLKTLGNVTDSKSTNGTSKLDAVVTVTQAPQGFDRLLQTGFSREDVATLRASFLAHLSNTHTPDTMPHGDTLRRLEERWLDADTQTAQTIGADGTTVEDDEGSALDDMLWGNICGFFWPMGAIVWGFREDGVWTRRRKIAVFTGLMINVVFGFARYTTSR